MRLGQRMLGAVRPTFADGGEAEIPQPSPDAGLYAIQRPAWPLPHVSALFFVGEPDCGCAYHSTALHGLFQFIAVDEVLRRRN
jgi:hypothetical protein